MDKGLLCQKNSTFVYAHWSVLTIEKSLILTGGAFWLSCTMPLTKLISRLKKAQATVFKDTFDNEPMKNFIIALNTDDPKTGQLFSLGIDSRGVSLKDIGGNPLTPSGYAPSTIEGRPGIFEGKRQKGQRFDHITLKDTGGFYRSFKVTVSGDTITLDANPNKNGSNLFNDWGENIIVLTDENSQRIIDFAKTLLPKAIIRQLVG